MSIRVLVADDHAEVRSTLVRILAAEPDIDVVGECDDGLTALEVAQRLAPDVAIVDIRMPRMDGLELTQLLAGPRARVPVKVVVATNFDDDEYVYGALRAGASGFLLKDAGPGLLVQAVRAAQSGDQLISPSVTVRLLQHLAPRTASTLHPELTPREIEVAELVGRGLTNAEVGAALFISLGTVKSHLSALQTKLEARNRVEIAAWAWSSGLLRP
ncbi:response regulator [Rathayibacter tanaceti]|uniref:Response regulator n=2 Tax=Rathayibacter tanaceti TaxID=1671680 RepID=A0A162GHX8_9MICO|nr:response regulator transcription factor [Rathayibacter tanaceti]KZX21449.1 Transcriptional regulatory protein LiaR [Rathayibacter tanaceti]QHC54353.1 response regulator [Rathayibacter tanaceti]TCO38034.1 DNA-binding NarL/FixJ family response regulator [Rathayibacter tanaceti]